MACREGRSVCRFTTAFPFNGLNLCEPSKVPLFLRLLCSQKRDNQFLYQMFSNHPGSEHQHIYVIVFGALVR